MINGDTVGLWNGARREMEEEGWRMVRTLRGGAKAMREARETYTPMTDSEKRQVARYNRRLKQSVLYPAFDDRVRSIASLPFQRAPTIEGKLPTPLDKIVDDADRCGTSLAAFSQRIYDDAIERGMGMIMVDNVPTAGMNQLEADAIDARPYFARIIPDHLVGFQTDVQHGRDVVTELRYREWLWRPGANGIDELVDRIRAWTPTDVQLWERMTGKQTIDREAEAGKAGMGGYKLVAQAPHGYPNGIPLVVVYTNKVATMQGKPALMEMAELNVGHWQRSSRHDAALEYCETPILKMSGASDEVAKQRPHTGAGATVVDTSEAFQMQFVEIAGTSLAASAARIDVLRLQMEALGMRPMMAAQGPETATGEVRADMAEKSQAQTWVEGLEWAIYQAFEMAANWLPNATLPEDFALTLFKDSSLIAGKATDMPLLQSMRSNRDISKKTYLAEVMARGVLVTVDDIEEELEQIQEEADAGFASMANRMIGQRDSGDGDDDDEEDEDEKPDDAEDEDEEDEDKKPAPPFAKAGAE